MRGFGAHFGRSLVAIIALLLSTLGGSRATSVMAFEPADDGSYVDSAGFTASVDAVVAAVAVEATPVAAPAVSMAQHRQRAVTAQSATVVVPCYRRGSAGGARAP